MLSKPPDPSSDKPHPEPHEAGAPKDKYDVTGSIQVRGIIETHVPPDLIQKRDAAEEKKETREKRRFIVECWTFAFVIIYAGLTGTLAYIADHQLGEARKVTTSTNENFERDQRAWVQIESISPVGHWYVPTERVGYKIVWKDFGRTPALKVAVDMCGEHLNKVSDRIFSNPSCIHSPEGVLFAGSEETITVSGKDINPSCTIRDRWMIDCNSVSGFVFVYGRITYKDVFGYDHWTQFCEQLQPNFVDFRIGENASCQAYNDADRNNQ